MQDEDLKEKIDRLEKIVEEDHKMIRSLYVRARIASGLRIFYWTIILILAISSYYYVQPYVAELRSVYDNLQSVQRNFNNPSVGDFFDKFKDSFRNPTSTEQQ